MGYKEDACHEDWLACTAKIRRVPNVPRSQARAHKAQSKSSTQAPVRPSVRPSQAEVQKAERCGSLGNPKPQSSKPFAIARIIRKRIGAMPLGGFAATLRSRLCVPTKMGPVLSPRLSPSRFLSLSLSLSSLSLSLGRAVATRKALLS